MFRFFSKDSIIAVMLGICLVNISIWLFSEYTMLSSGTLKPAELHSELFVLLRIIAGLTIILTGIMLMLLVKKPENKTSVNHKQKDNTESANARATVYLQHSLLEEIDVTTLVHNVSLLVNSVKECASLSQDIIMQMMETYEFFADEMTIVIDDINQVAERCEQIQRLLFAVEDEVIELDFLSLHTIIDAAYLGKQGEGFVKVAEDVNHYAKRAEASVSDCREKVKVLQSQSVNSVTSLNDSAQALSACVDNIKMIDNVLNSTNIQLDSLTMLEREIDTLSQEFDTGIQSIKEHLDKTKH